MRIKQLEYVLEVAKCKSFSKASKKLFIAQPSLSTSVSALEEELGVNIFLRTPQGAVLTEEGEAVVAQIEQILAQISALQNITEQNNKQYVITLAAIPAACNAMTISLLEILAKEHAEITLSLLEIRPQKILASLANGLADIVIGSYTEITKKQTLQEAKKNNLILEPILTDKLYVYLSRNHPKANRLQISLKELKDERQAIFNDFLVLDGDETGCTEEQGGMNYYTFSDRSSIKQAVAAGLAYAVLPHQMVLDDIYVNSGLVKAIPIADSAVEITNYVAWRKSNYTPRQETILLNNIRALYSDIGERLSKITPCIKCDGSDDALLRY